MLCIDFSKPDCALPEPAELIHHLEGAARYASEISPVPIVNAGDGANQHPSQTMLDLYSIYKTQGTLENQVITMVGDLKYGRTVHSLLEAMHFWNPRFNFVACEELKMPDKYKRFCEMHGIEYRETTDTDHKHSHTLGFSENHRA